MDDAGTNADDNNFAASSTEGVTLTLWKLVMKRYESF